MDARAGREVWLTNIFRIVGATVELVVSWEVLVRGIVLGKFALEAMANQDKKHAQVRNKSPDFGEVERSAS